MEDSASQFQEILNRIPNGVVVLTQEGRVIYFNEQARENLQSQSSISLLNDSLVFTDKTTQEQFNTELKAVFQQHSNTTIESTPVCIQNLSYDLPLSLTVSVLSSSDNSKLALIILAPPSLPIKLTETCLRESFQLTNAESALVMEIIRSRDLQEAAGKLNITRNTAKSQLKSIFLKTGVCKQTELLKLLLSDSDILVS
ncbi:hypothetical protein BOW37_07190 [Solemya velum gill symbiont]|uniref:helix-turn-helix transcriptional regulator n=1 Tax=Solemya velum gill symbiont TaxID=2340 RepID=UPI000997083C|nr:helix-turn-helix transcriptional regulator [Solemya velum gill symbiont]OOZ44386.1 hypothetical protein BOW37_07190 [Solemya velum gill symbiont]